MMIGLTIVLGASLLLFIGSLAYAIVANWMEDRVTLQKMVMEHMVRSGFKPKANFDRVARRPVRVLGSFIL